MKLRHKNCKAKINKLKSSRSSKSPINRAEKISMISYIIKVSYIFLRLSIQSLLIDITTICLQAILILNKYKIFLYKNTTGLYFTMMLKIL